MLDSLQLLGQKGLRFFQRLGRGHILLVNILTALPSLFPRFGLVIKQTYAVGVLSLVIIVVS
ncbi:MAG: hypothetical protein R3354_09060, partial [Thiohalomonadales bacterium]|nr:hypothetical protein [Thiohalomonadales bacterium]